MKNLINISFLALIFSLYSCVGPEPPETHTSFDIVNNSDHKINLHVFPHNPHYDTTYILNKDDHLFFSYYTKGNPGPPPFVSDSVRVAYDDSIFIMHYRLAEQIASRSILLYTSWTGGEADEYVFRWQYFLTNEDYNEALENH